MINMYEVVGIVGVFMILVAYFLLQTNAKKTDDFSYLWLNLLGGVFIAVSLVYDWNLPAFIMEVCWISITVYSMVKKLKRA